MADDNRTRKARTPGRARDKRAIVATSLDPGPALRDVARRDRMLSAIGLPAPAARTDLASRIAFALSSTLPAIGSGATLPAEVTQRPSLPLDLLATSVTLRHVAAPADLEVLAITVATSMDPRLQLAIANRRNGKPGLALASTAADEVAVIALVTSVDDWEALPDVMPGSVVGQNSEDSWIVTGRVPIERAEAVRAAPCIVSLKSSQQIQPTLGATVSAMGVAPAAMPQGTDPDGGKGVVVGIVDFGCDFMHRNFRNADGTTRIEALWHQAGVTSPTSPFGYGRLLSAADINAALAEPSPYTALDYGPDPDSATSIGSHGTHVIDIAAGNGLGSGQAGVASEATIIFVEASTTDVSFSGPASTSQSFGDSAHLLEAVRFIFDTAGDRPCAVNISLGTNGGPHDGTSLVEQGLDAIVNERPNRAVVIAASNSQLDNIHTSGTVPPAGDHDIVWQQSSGGGEFELWYPGARRLQISLVAPDGTIFGPVAPGGNLPVGTNNAISVFISNRLDDPNNHDNVIGIWVAGRLSGGDWSIRLASLDATGVDYHAWIERYDPAQSSFAAPVPSHTLGSISTGRDSIVVGCFDGHKPAFPIASFTSSGPTRDGRFKPEISAPGNNVFAARSRTLTGVTRKSGTSMSAPAVTGLCALIFAEAARHQKALSISELRARIMAGALLAPPAIPAGRWDDRYGYGRASGASIIDRL